MTPGWQVVVYGAALVLFVLAAFAAKTNRRDPTVLLSLGLALVTLVSLWAAAAAN